MLIADYEALRATRFALLGFEDRYSLDVYEGEPSDKQIAAVSAPPSHAEVLRAIGPLSRRSVCDGGTVRVMSDVWDNCPGCCGCAGLHTSGYRQAAGSYSRPNYEAARAQFEACRSIGIFVWRAARLDADAALYQSVAGFDMLARLGRQIAAVAAIGAAINAFVCWAVSIDAKPIKGFWYRVDGKRGKARDHYGVEGECVKIHEESYVEERPRGWRGTWRGRTSTTLRASILPLGAEQPIKVAASNLVRIPTPAAGAQRSTEREHVLTVRAVRPNYCGRTKRGADIGCVVNGPYRGITGEVFWSNVTDVLGNEARVGVKTSRDGKPLWNDARDVIGPAKRFVEFAKNEIDRLEDSSGAYKAERLQAVLAGAYACVEALVEAGFEAAAVEWGEATKQIARLLANASTQALAVA